MKVLAVLEALPGTGKVKARRLMEHVGISETRRLQGLGAKQRESLLEAVSPALILVVCGPGGVGKGTVIRRLVAADGRLWLSRSWTTRARRPGEPEDAYTFVDRDDVPGARRRRAASSSGRRSSASTTAHPRPSPPEGDDVVLEIDVQGARQVLERCPDASCVLIRAAVAGHSGAAPAGEGRLRGAHPAPDGARAGWRRRRASSWRPTSWSTTTLTERYATSRL